MSSRIVPSTCRECYLGCGSLIHLEDGKVTKISGNPAHPHSRGAFCTKGINAPIAARDHHDRILRPLRRVGSRGGGDFQPVSWEEAFSAIADGFGDIIKEHGARAIAGAVSGHFYDRGVAMALLLRGIGTPNYMVNQDLCQGGRATASLLTGIPMLPGIELKKARAIFAVGKSPSESNVIEWINIKAAKRAGAVLIVADPRRTQIAQAADIWLPIRPGTDAALALALIHVLFAENLLDRPFVDQWCVGANDLCARAQTYTPAYAAEVTGVSAELIVDAARRLGTTKPLSMLLGHGVDAQHNAVHTAMAFNALLALTGNVDKEGTNQIPKRYPGFRDYNSFVGDPSLRMPAEREQEIIGGQAYPFWSSPHSVHQACHNPSVIEAVLTGQPYPVRAIYASGVNIVCTYPGMQRTIDAIKSLDMFVVATDHMTPTAQFADFILPKTTQLEEEAIFIEDNCLSIMQKAVPARGEVKTDFEIAIGLRDALRARELLAFETLPWNSHREFVDSQLADSDITFDDLCAAGFHEFPFEYEAYAQHGFATPSGKIELSSRQLEAKGYAPTPDYKPAPYAAAPPQFDLTLLTGIRTMALHHSRFRNHDWARRLHNVPDLRIHPATAMRTNISNGDWVWVEVPGGAGRACLKASITDEVPADVVATGMGWWFPELSGPDFGALTFNVEAAIPYGPHWDPISGSAEARNCACRIYRANPADIPTIPSRKLVATN
jgi:anaerobic selenocysteine-containing dehydrogenase